MAATVRSAVIGLLLIIVVGTIVIWQKQSSNVPDVTAVEMMVNTETQADDTATNTQAADTNETSSAPSGISAAEVATHNGRASCWSTINGNVYDLTSWIPNHPGGEQNILRLCGIDGSSLFNRQHGRNNRVLSVLAGFKIGVAAQ